MIVGVHASEDGLLDELSSSTVASDAIALICSSKTIWISTLFIFPFLMYVMLWVKKKKDSLLNNNLLNYNSLNQILFNIFESNRNRDSLVCIEKELTAILSFPWPFLMSFSCMLPGTDVLGWILSKCVSHYEFLRLLSGLKNEWTWLPTYFIIWLNFPMNLNVAFLKCCNANELLKYLI